jgi:hypothetical protein
MNHRSLHPARAALIFLLAAGCNEPAHETDPVATAKFVDKINAAEAADRRAAIAAAQAREKATAEAAAKHIERATN